jgi:hypothetical protein
MAGQLAVRSIQFGGGLHRVDLHSRQIFAISVYVEKAVFLAFQ